MNIVGIALVMFVAQSGAIQGIVVRGTNYPLSKANVELRRDGTNETILDSTITSDNGRFVFQNVPPGRYQLTVTRAGYVRSPVPIVVNANQPVLNMQVPMTPASAIAGTIYDGNSEALGNVEVQALKASYPEGRRVLTPVASAVTNDLGEYRLFWLEPGRYYIAAVPDSFERRMMSGGNISIVGGPFYSSAAVADPALGRPDLKTRNGRDVPVYFSGTIDEQTAAPIEVRAGSEVLGINVVVAAVSERHVRGVVVDGVTGKPAQYASLQRETKPEPFGPDDFVVNSESGSFDVTLLPGTHTLVANSANGSAYATIQVGNTDIDNLTLLTMPAFKLRGRISVEGRIASADLEKLRISLRRDPPPAGAPSLAKPSYSNPLADSTFTLDATPGNYRVNIAPLLNLIPDFFASASPASLQNAYIKSIRFWAADVLNTGLRVDRPPEALLEIVIGTNPGGVGGSVVDANGKSIPDASVVILPDTRPRFDLFRAVISDPSGRFRFERVPPGDYKIFAWADVDRDAWFDPEFMRNFENRGTAVHITEGSQTNISLTALSPP